MISKSGVHLPDTTYGRNPIAWKDADDSDEELRRLRAENAKLMTSAELYHKVKSEMLFNRAVMSVMAALIVSGTRAEEPRCIFWYLVLYAAYSTARSFEEYMMGSNG